MEWREGVEIVLGEDAELTFNEEDGPLYTYSLAIPPKRLINTRSSAREVFCFDFVRQFTSQKAYIA